MKKLVLSAVLIAFYGYAMEYPGPIEKEGKQEKVKGKPAEKIPQVGIRRIENKSDYNIQILLNGKPVTDNIRPGESKSVRIKVPMKAVKQDDSIKYESAQKISVVSSVMETTYMRDIPIVIIKEANKYKFKLDYDNIMTYITGVEEEFPATEKLYDFNITLILEGYMLNYSTAEVIAVE